MAEQSNIEQVASDLALIITNDLLAITLRERAGRALSLIRAQAEEIERLKARGVTVDELLVYVHSYAETTSSVNPMLTDLCNILRPKGLLIEDAPKQERIYGVDVPPADQIPQYEIKRDEADPLKVELDPRGLICKHDGMVLAEKHNALVDYVKERAASDERATSGAFDDVYARIAALEARLSQPVEQKAWPRLPPKEAWLNSFIREELARIRTALGVKEAE